MRVGGKALRGLMMVAWVCLSPAWARAAALDAPPEADPAPAITTDAQYLQRWVLETGDAHQQPFAVVDKKAARIFVFDAEGRLVGAANALLGQAPGDQQALTHVSDSQVAQLALADRTTPAGRFTRNRAAT